MSSIQMPCYSDNPAELEGFLEDMENYFTAVDLSTTDKASQCAAQLLCQAGAKIRQMFKANWDIVAKLDN